MPKTFSAQAVLKFVVDSRVAERGFRRMHGNMSRLYDFTRRFRAGALGMNNMLMGQGAVMVGAGLAARSAVRSYERYSVAQSNMRAILATTGASLQSQNLMMQVADHNARRFGFGLSEASEAMNTLRETGVNSHEAMRLFGIGSEFARAAGESLADSNQLLVDGMRQFGLSGEEGVRNFASMVTVGSRLASTTIPQMRQAMRYAGTEMSALGFEASEVVAGLGAMSAIGLRGMTAGTRMRGAILALTRVTNRSRDIVTQYGLEHQRLDTILFDETGNLRSLIEVSDQLSGVFRDLPTDAARASLMTSLFGRRAYAAGVILGGLHSQSGRFREVLEQLSDQERVNQGMTRASEEATRGFGHQMRLARIAAEELGIAFMSVGFGADDASQGFGTFLSQLSLATRLAGTGNLAGVSQEALAELTPEMRQLGREVHETFTGIWQLLRLLGRAGVWLGSVANDIGPTWTIALLAVGSVLRPVVFGMFSLFRAASLTVGPLGLVGSILGGILSVIGGLALADPLGRLFSSMAEGEGLMANLVEEYDRLGAASDEYINNSWAGWVRHIPILREAVRTVGRLVQVTREAASAELNLFRQRATVRERELGGAVSERIDRRTRQYMHQGRFRGMSTEERRIAAANTIMADQMTNLATMLRTQGLSANEAMNRFREMMIEGGMDAQQAGELQNQFGAFASHSLSTYENMLPHVQNLGQNADAAAGDIGRLAQAISSMQNVQRIQQTALGTVSSSMPAAAQDAAVTRTGYLPFPVSAGDVLVNRDSLASAITANAGGMVPTGQRTQASATDAGSTPNVNLEGDFSVEIPVMIDGREIARASGRYNLQVDQRRGVSLSPASRRQVAQSGTPR